MDYKKYEALDKSRQKLLCFCAFIGGNIEPQSLKEYAKISSVALTKVTSYVKELTNGSFLQSEGFDWRSHLPNHSGTLLPGITFPVCQSCGVVGPVRIIKH